MPETKDNKFSSDELEAARVALDAWLKSQGLDEMKSISLMICHIFAILLEKASSGDDLVIAANRTGSILNYMAQTTRTLLK